MEDGFVFTWKYDGAEISTHDVTVRAHKDSNLENLAEALTAFVRACGYPHQSRVEIYYEDQDRADALDAREEDVLRREMELDRREDEMARAEETLEAKWAVDSETGEWTLRDLKTGEDITPTETVEDDDETDEIHQTTDAGYWSDSKTFESDTYAGAAEDFQYGQD